VGWRRSEKSPSLGPDPVDQGSGGMRLALYRPYRRRLNFRIICSSSHTKMIFGGGREGRAMKKLTVPGGGNLSIRGWPPTQFLTNKEENRERKTGAVCQSAPYRGRDEANELAGSAGVLRSGAV